jgi:cell division cycle 2-like protein
VCDLGLARHFTARDKELTPKVVTLWYRSPELLLELGKYSKPIDIWSVGCIFAELILREPLFKGQNEPEQLDIIFRTLGSPTDHSWPEFKDILASKQVMINPRNMSNKLSERFAEINRKNGTILNHQGFDLLSKMLTYSPNARITAEQALNHSWFKEHPFACDPIQMPKFKAYNKYPREVRKRKKVA